LHCPNCGFENPEGRRFCEECGEKLAGVEVERARERKRSQREAVRYRLEAEKKGMGAEEAERIRRRRTRRHARPWMGLVLLAVVIVAVVVLVIVLTSGGKSGPEKAVIAFYDSLENRDFLSYLKYTEPELYKMAQNGEYPEEVYADQAFYYDQYEVDGLETELVKEEGDVAEVRLTAGIFKGWKDMGNITDEVDFSSYPRTIELVRIEGVWTIPYYNIANQPTNLPEVLPGDSSEFPEVDESAGEPS
jgi:predicted nucleic acid-binding Zn ribbon protein